MSKADQLAQEIKALEEELAKQEIAWAEWREKNYNSPYKSKVDDLQPLRDKIHVLQIRLGKLTRAWPPSGKTKS